MSSNKAFIILNSLNKKSSNELITPHKLAVVFLIKQFCKFKESNSFQNLPIATRKPHHVKSFCILILKLLQSPDLSLEELRNLLLSGQYTISPVLIEKFDAALCSLNALGTGFLLDETDYISQLLLDSSMLTAISKNSVLGCYLRRFYIRFDKLTFAEMSTLLEDFKAYYKPSAKLISIAKFGMQEVDDLSHKCKKILKPEDWFVDREQWTRRQAELFIATQAALITNNEESALSPPELQKHISNLLRSNPDLSEAHFLSYLNHLRVKEFCGAIDSLYHCFDRSNPTDGKNSTDEKSKCYRYAALNLAILHEQFGHKEEALAALKEAIRIAQDANDNVCLQHALTWMYRLTDANKDFLIEHSILKSLDLNLTYTLSLSIQSYMQHAGLSGGNPKQIFETITKSDVLNSQHAYRDLMSNSYAQKSCLWLLYGKSEMSSLWSQLLLFLNTDNLTLGKTFYGEGTCQALCNVHNQLILDGKYDIAYAILALAKAKFPNEPLSKNWFLCENLCIFQRSLHLEEWTDAEMAANRIAIVDKWESCLRMGELHLAKRDYAAAQSCVNIILDKCQAQGESKLSIHFRIRAMILFGEIQCASNFPKSTPAGIITVLNSAHADLFDLEYLSAMIHLHVANLQLIMKLPGQALKILDKCMVQILAHGGKYDRARASLLYVKCLVAKANFDQELSKEERTEALETAAKLLDTVVEDFKTIEAYSKMKDSLYLQACIYNQIELKEERNRCAMMFTTCDKEYPSKNVYTLATTL